MSDCGADPRQKNWTQCCGCVRIFGTFRMGFHWAKLLPAFCGIVATCLAGVALDAVWPSGSQPAVGSMGQVTVTELDAYLAAPANAITTTEEWIKSLGDVDSVKRIGAFDLLLHHARASANGVAASVLQASPGGVLGSLVHGFNGLAWLLAMHTGYAIVYFLILVAIWGFFGGAISRAAVLDVCRDEKISLREAFAFAKSRYMNFAAAPLVPIGFILVGALALWLGGLIGAIPAVGEIFVGLAFFIALLIGFLIALVIVCGAVGLPLLMPAIAADNLDALDALSTTYSFVGARPWKTAFCALVALCYGAVCMILLKLFVMIMLFAVGHFAGASMNWGDAYAKEGGQRVKVESKLDAMWQAPAFDGGRPFFGSFGERSLSHVSWFGQLCIKVWIYSVWGLVAACIVGYFYSASSVIYVLLRKEVDLTDIEDVYLEDGKGEEGSGTSSADSPTDGTDEAGDKSAPRKAGKSKSKPPNEA